MDKPKHFSVDARAMLTWGRHSIKDSATAVLELVKNSYDAGATVVEVVIKASKDDASSFLRIADNGCGMTEEDVDNNWLRIGYSEKQQKKKTAAGRRKTGEKGIGRISADRLGAVLELKSQARKKRPVGLRVDWNSFDVPGKDLSEVPIEVMQSTDFLIPRPAKFNKSSNTYDPPPTAAQASLTNSGTELTIRKLRQHLLPSDIQDLHRDFSLLVPPFGGVRDFQIRLDNDIVPDLNGVVSSVLYRVAEIEARFTLRGDDVLSEFYNRTAGGTMTKPRKETLKWSDFAHRPQSLFAEQAIGPAKVHLLFYPRISEIVKGTDLTLQSLREFLNRYAGIKVYRDNVRVMPYGDPTKPEGDWLGLGDRKARNPAGPGRPDYRVAPNQIVGVVLLGRDSNPALIDTSGREGLVNSEEFSALKSFIFGCLIRLEAQYHEMFIARNPAADIPPPPRETLNLFADKLKGLDQSLRSVEEELPESGSEAVETARENIGEALSGLRDVHQSMETLASQATIYRGLASVGIAAATFGHETELFFQGFLATLFTAKSLLKKDAGNINDALDEIEKSILNGERLCAWGAFALHRISRDKRRLKECNVTELLDTLIVEMRPAIAASDIDLRADIGPIQGRTFPMDVESVAVNLLTNAYYFCKLSKSRRVIQVVASGLKNNGKPGFGLTVSDSGPGVAKDIAPSIWEPLFSTKTDKDGRPFGTGLGLSIVDAVVKDLQGSRSVSKDPDLKGARFEVWLPMK